MATIKVEFLPIYFIYELFFFKNQGVDVVIFQLGFHSRVAYNCSHGLLTFLELNQ